MRETKSLNVWNGERSKHRTSKFWTATCEQFPYYRELPLHAPSSPGQLVISNSLMRETKSLNGWNSERSKRRTSKFWMLPSAAGRWQLLALDCGDSIISTFDHRPAWALGSGHKTAAPGRKQRLIAREIF